MSKGYNGYKNWETWNVLLWIDNEQRLYRLKLDWLKARNAKEVTSSAVKAFCGDLMPSRCTPDMDPGEWDAISWAQVAAVWRDDRREAIAYAKRVYDRKGDL